MHAHVLAFIAVAWLILITPGVDMALVIRNALQERLTGAVLIGLGIRVALER
jgi:threonine/homoserine/homoserine lactone efflux protein